ncbi:MAG: ATP-dependent Clp protease proteolytic subunit [Bifidobacteriaceae bacterium]|jgi:ATP-dependent Clp protease protease subunit|nr:ATP-dependent Clp protease proteolytic subunit [Bifidobacteriaceae bacterium]
MKANYTKKNHDENNEKKAFRLEESIYKKLLEKRIVWLGTEVNEDSANLICAELMLLASEDPKKDIWLFINSPGGSITAGMAIYDTMQLIEPDVCTITMGLAASMGQFLLSSGAKGKRYATKYSRIMMHEPAGGIGGTATDVRIEAELILHMRKVLSELTAEQTNKTLKQILSDNELDNWFTADGAKDYGFVDHVIENAKDFKIGV